MLQTEPRLYRGRIAKFGLDTAENSRRPKFADLPESLPICRGSFLARGAGPLNLPVAVGVVRRHEQLPERGRGVPGVDQRGLGLLEALLPGLQALLVAERRCFAIQMLSR